jgi:hypothetical protein
MRLVGKRHSHQTQHILTQQLLGLTAVIVWALGARANPGGHTNGTTPVDAPLGVTLILTFAHVARTFCKNTAVSNLCYVVCFHFLLQCSSTKLREVSCLLLATADLYPAHI